MLLANYMENSEVHELSLENLKTKDIEDHDKNNQSHRLHQRHHNHGNNHSHSINLGLDHHQHTKMELDPPPTLNKSNKSSSNTLLHSSPPSFKVSPSETSDDTNETSPSSIEDQIDATISDATEVDLETQTDHPTIEPQNNQSEVGEEGAVIELSASRTGQLTELESSAPSHSVKVTIPTSFPVLHSEIDPLHVPDGEDVSDYTYSHTTTNNNNNNENAKNSFESTQSNTPHTNMKNRRHTTPASIIQKRNSMDNPSASKFISKPPISRSTFPSSNSTQQYKPLRSRNSTDSYSRQDSTNFEINRMRNSILVRRNLKKKRKEFLEDEKVLVGNKISEGHENFVMAYNMLTGIRVAVSRCSGIMKKITDEDFSTTKKLSFNMDGSELTPSSKYDFKFKDYSPEVFRELRSMFGLDPADYLVSITGKYILSELGSPGKSGSFFYFSRDYRFIIKTIHHSEHKQLRKILKIYYEHVKNNPNTLISQIYGLHRVKIPAFGSGGNGGSTRKVHFLVMNNLFPPHRDIHVKYDLKGSTWGRITKINETNKKPQEIEEELTKHTLKDLNWLNRDDKIKFGPLKKKLFFDQLDKDVKFLKQANVMDYSLLLGVHNVKKGNSQSNEMLQKLSVFDPKLTNKADLINTNPRDIDRQNDLPSNVFPGRSQYVFYGHDGGIRSTNEDNEPLGEIYYLGIIDCLTNYSVKKKLETFWRSLSHARLTISSVPAKEYGDRFLDFIKKGVTTPKKKVN